MSARAARLQSGKPGGREHPREHGGARLPRCDAASRRRRPSANHTRRVQASVGQALQAEGGMNIFDRSKRVFGKRDIVDDLSHDLDRARARRDAIAADVTTLTAEIAELEARLLAESDRRDRARAVAEIEELTNRLGDAARVFAPALARLCDAAAAVGALVPAARDLSGFLDMLVAEVGREI